MKQEKKFLKYPNEMVLAIEKSKLHNFQGFSACDAAYVFDNETVFLQRDEAEENENYKQIIPYAVFLDIAGRVVCYTRGGAGGEKRLTAKKSIGIGGHVNPEDGETGQSFETYMRGVEREIREELKITGEVSQRIVGMVNDDSNPVGRVHVGIVHLFTFDGRIESNEPAIQDLRLFYLDTLIEEEYDNLETWSQIVLDAFSYGKIEGF